MKPEPVSTRDWHRADVMAALKKAGTNLRQLSLANGYSRNAASNACSKPYPRLEVIIAEAIGRKPDEIWPERYARRFARAQNRLLDHSTKCVQAHSPNDCSEAE